MYLNDLDELVNIIDDIVSPEFSDEDRVELFETCLHLIQEYNDENPNAISDPDFKEILFNEVFDILEVYIDEMNGDGYDEDELQDTVLDAVDYYFEYISPPRWSTELVSVDVEDQQPVLFEEEGKKKKDKKDKTREQIAYLNSLPQPAQRTPEWYTYRHNLITASNAYKAFDTQSSKNQLIYEKCKPISMISSNNVNVSSPMHWGQKYEAVSVMIYESKYNAKITDFGCIQHRKYSFLGASPDGINTDEDSPNYGRMLEIKNPTTRVITGEPKKEYWVQCQLQMETCDLDECDFLETKFAEYENEDAFTADGTFFTSLKQEMKGIMLYFVDSERVPKYIYKPLNMEKEEFDKWEQEMIEMYEDKHNYTWIKNNYWKLVQISCVLVKRNDQWFQSNIQALDDLWKIVLQERVTGYEHRAPKSKHRVGEIESQTMLELGVKIITPVTKSTNLGSGSGSGSGCMLKLSTNPFTGAVTVIKNEGKHHVIM
jgi:putative phage-type endonuclease